MSDDVARKAKAGAKMALGAGRMVSGVVLATGHGLLGSFLRSHHMMRMAAVLGKNGVEGGMKQFNEGLDEWKAQR